MVGAPARIARHVEQDHCPRLLATQSNAPHSSCPQACTSGRAVLGKPPHLLVMLSHCSGVIPVKVNMPARRCCARCVSLDGLGPAAGGGSGGVPTPHTAGVHCLQPLCTPCSAAPAAPGCRRLTDLLHHKGPVLVRVDLHQRIVQLLPHRLDAPAAAGGRAGRCADCCLAWRIRQGAGSAPQPSASGGRSSLAPSGLREPQRPTHRTAPGWLRRTAKTRQRTEAGQVAHPAIISISPFHSLNISSLPTTCVHVHNRGRMGTESQRAELR